MTVIAAIEDGESVHMCADSGVSTEDAKDVGAEKIWLHASGIGFGVAGDVRGCQLVRYRLKVPRRVVGVSGIEWCVTKLVPAIREALDDNDEELDIELIAAFDGAVYHIGGDFSVTRSPRKHSEIGTGAGIAYGSLSSTEGRPPKERVEAAVRAACERDPSCSLPLMHIKVSAKAGAK